MTATQMQLHMRRSLEHLPELVIPDGYALCTFQPGDVARWITLMNENGALGAWDDARADTVFQGGERVPFTGSFFLTDGDEPVATAQLTPRLDTPDGPMPELGWVAVSPRYQGAGLGYVICLAVMRHAASLGHSSIFLMTDDERLPAIATYFKLGFEPWMVDETMPGRWSALRAALRNRETERPG